MSNNTSNSPAYTPQQELANTITHGIGILFGLVAIPVIFVMAYRRGVKMELYWSLGLYSFGLLMVYLNSTLYHALRPEKVKRTFKVLDHISIFLMIAGTTTFFVIRYTPWEIAYPFLAVQWIAVLVGIGFKLFFTGRFKVLSTILYTLLGGMALLLIKPLSANMPTNVMVMLGIGGGCYLVGTIFYLWRKLYYHHAIWHVFVLGGTAAHFVGLVNSLG